MRWEITTQGKTHVVSAFSSMEAISKVRQYDNSDIKGAKLLPKNAMDNVKELWRKFTT